MYQFFRLRCCLLNKMYLDKKKNNLGNANSHKPWHSAVSDILSGILQDGLYQYNQCRGDILVTVIQLYGQGTSRCDVD